MDDHFLNCFKNGADISDAFAYKIQERMIDSAIGENFKIHTVHAITEIFNQNTFDSKHKLVNDDDIKRHYNKFIKIERLNKNLNSKVLYGFENGQIMLENNVINNIWHDNCTENCDYCKIIPFEKFGSLLYVEQGRKFKRDIIGAFMFHNIVMSLFKDISPSLIVFAQCFNIDNDDKIKSITRNNAYTMKDVLTGITFESIEQQLEQYVYKKKESLTESTSRDILGRPVLNSFGEFDLIFKNGSIERNFKSRFKSKYENVRSFSKVSTYSLKRVETYAPKHWRRQGILFNCSVGTVQGNVTKFKVLFKTKRIFNVRKFNKRSLSTSKHKITNEIDKLTSQFDLKKHFIWSSRLSFMKYYRKFLSHRDINMYYPLLVHSPPLQYRLKKLTLNSNNVLNLRNKFHINDFKTFILNNITDKQHHEIMIPDYKESSRIIKRSYQLKCVVCNMENKHKTRRKKWKCIKCKTDYWITMSNFKKKILLDNFLNENCLVYNDEGYWIVVPPPQRYAHIPRIMLDSINRYFKDIKIFYGRPLKTILSKKKMTIIKKKIHGFTNNPKWYIYPMEVPLIFDSVKNQLKGGKDNFVRKKVAAKRCKSSARLTMTVNPNLMPHELELPRLVWQNLGFPNFVIAIRYPSLCKLNITLHQVLPYNPHSNELALTARAPPTICSGHNLDFDGDAMTFIKLNHETEWELQCLIHPSNNFSVNGNMRLNFSKDAMLGLGFDDSGSKPFHEILEKYFLQCYFSVEYTSEQLYKKFLTYERFGLNNVVNNFFSATEEKIYEYICSKTSKMNKAHFYTMFKSQENLKVGMSKNTFIKSCMDSRKALLDTPTNASDDGHVFTLSISVLPDYIQKYDYTLRRQNNTIVNYYSFMAHPRYGKIIDFPVYDRNKMLSKDFCPRCKLIKQKRIVLNFNKVNKIIKSMFKFIEVYELQIPHGDKICGRLIYNDVMKNLGFFKNVPYVVYFTSLNRRICYMFEFM